jgi:hypothetical protein
MHGPTNEGIMTYSVIDVTTVFANPFSLPVLGFLFYAGSLSSGGLLIAKDM